MRNQRTCPYLKEVVMLYCDACAVKKMVPLDHLASASPCMLQDYRGCPLYQELVQRLGVPAEDETREGPEGTRAFLPGGRESIQ